MTHQPAAQKDHTEKHGRPLSRHGTIGHNKTPFGRDHATEQRVDKEVKMGDRHLGGVDQRLLKGGEC